MGTTSEKLTYLNTTKTLIKDELNLGGANITNEPFRQYSSKLHGIYKDFLANGTDTLWNNWDKVSGENTSLSLSPTIKGKMKIDLKGNTQQNGTPTPSTPIPVQVVSGDNTIKVEGKNLYYGTSNEYSFTPLSSTWYFVNGETGATGTDIGTKTLYKAKVKSGETYTIKAVRTTQSNSQLCYSDETIIQINGQNNISASNLANGVTFTATRDDYVILRIYCSANNNEKVSNVQLEKGSSATTYTPYVSQSYPISLGVENYLQDEYIQAPEGNTINAILKKGTYTIFTEDGETFGNNIYFKLFDNNGTAITTSGHLTTANFTINFSSSSYYYYGGNSREKIIFTLDNDYKLNIGMINATGTRKAFVIKGNTPQYVSTTPIELCKIGTYQDKIYKDSGKWYLHKEIGKVVFDENTPILNNQDYISIGRFNTTGYTNIKRGSANNPNAISTHFKSQYVTANGNIYVSGVANELCLIDTDYSNNLAGFKTWLGTEKPIAYYVLATPTNTEITGELLSQLNALEGARSYDNQTNVSQVNNDYPFIVSATALEMI